MTYNLIGLGGLGTPALVERIPELIVHRKHPVVATHRCPGPIPATAIPPPPAQPTGEPDLFSVPEGFPF